MSFEEKQGPTQYMSAAALLLMRHYDMEEARKRVVDLNKRTEGSVMDVMILATAMSMSEEPWWDSEDPKVRASTQLEHTMLILPSLEGFVNDVEEALGREVGENLQDKLNNITANAPRFVAEIRGETYVDPLEGLMKMLSGAGEFDDDMLEELQGLAVDAGVSTEE